MKNNPVRDKSPVPGDDFIMLPDPRTAITICSKDTMNITVSKCCLGVFNNLAKVNHLVTQKNMHFLSMQYHCNIHFSRTCKMQDFFFFFT